VLNQQPILVAEDEPFIAVDLALAIEDAGGQVIGPAASTQEALALLGNHTVVAAILDVNLVGGDVSPVVEYLAARGVPFILQTGKELPTQLAARFPDLLIHSKPNISSRLVSELETLIDAHQGRVSGKT
jgi:CheY-like chemotaxis protein